MTVRLRSLCKACQSVHGNAYTIFISHEITQLLIPLLKYIPCEVKKGKCHFYFNLKSCQIIEHDIFERAADVSLLLVWLKIVDAKIDGEFNTYRLLHSILRNKVCKIHKKIPSKLLAELENYKSFIIESSNIEDLSKMTNRLAASLFGYVIENVELSQQLRKNFKQLAGLYGNIITEADFLIDYNKDKICNIKMYELIENNLFQTFTTAKKMVEELNVRKEANNYFKTSFYLSVKETYDKIEKTNPNKLQMP